MLASFAGALVAVLIPVSVHAASIHVQDQKSSGTDGGSSVAGYQVRTLNTIVFNTITGASLASNQVTLPAGSYFFEGFSGAYEVGMHRLSLFNVTAGATTTIGVGTRSDGAGPGLGSGHETATINGSFTIAATSTFEVRHYTEVVVVSFGLGVALTQGTEVYSSYLFSTFATATSVTSTSSATSTDAAIASTTAAILSAQFQQNLANGFFLFLLVFGGIVWYFKRNSQL